MTPGKDATEAFEDVGHSDEARALLVDMLVGDYEGASVREIHPRIFAIKSYGFSLD